MMLFTYYRLLVGFGLSLLMALPVQAGPFDNVLKDLNKASGQLKKLERKFKKPNKQAPKQQPAPNASRSSPQPAQAQPAQNSYSSAPQGPLNLDFPWETVNINMEPDELEKTLNGAGLKMVRKTNNYKDWFPEFRGNWQGIHPTKIKLKGRYENIYSMRIETEYPASSLAQLVDYFSKHVNNYTKSNTPCGTTSYGFGCINLKDEKLSQIKGKNHYRHINARLNNKSRKVRVTYQISGGLLR